MGSYWKAKRKNKKARRKALKKRLKVQEQKVHQELNKLKEEIPSPPNEIQVEELLCEGIAGMAGVVREFSRKQEPEVPEFPPERFDSVKNALNERIKEQQQKEEERKKELPPEEKPLSNRQKKERRRLKIAELKQLVDRPDIVEEHDCNSADPRLLIFLKCQRNTIPVPEHWG